MIFQLTFFRMADKITDGRPITVSVRKTFSLSMFYRTIFLLSLALALSNSVVNWNSSACNGHKLWLIISKTQFENINWSNEKIFKLQTSKLILEHFCVFQLLNRKLWNWLLLTGVQRFTEVLLPIIVLFRNRRQIYYENTYILAELLKYANCIRQQIVAFI